VNSDPRLGVGISVRGSLRIAIS